jgi:hypothetical protein
LDTSVCALIQCNAPVLCPSSVAAFLHENYLNFIDHEAMEDVAAASAYLSDSGRCNTAKLHPARTVRHILCSVLFKCSWSSPLEPWFQNHTKLARHLLVNHAPPGALANNKMMGGLRWCSITARLTKGRPGCPPRGQLHFPSLPVHFTPLFTDCGGLEKPSSIEEYGTINSFAHVLLSTCLSFLFPLTCSSEENSSGGRLL